MGTSSLNMTAGVDFIAAGEVASGQALVDGFEDATGGDFNRNHVDTATTSFITKGAAAPSAPVSGEIWDDGSQMFRYTSSGWEAISWAISDTAPSGASEGSGWYDTALSMHRIYGTIDSVTGWHPTNGVDMLMSNDTGSTIDLGHVVIVTPGSGVRNVQVTTTVKDLRVAGVALEEILNTESGVVRRNVAGAVVSVLADGSDTDGAIIQGDCIATYDTGGECRTVGQFVTTPYQDADHGRVEGLQAGAFAVAHGARDASTDLVSAVMLGEVGRGMTVWTARESVDPTLTADGTWQELTLPDALLTDLKHKPLSGAWVSAQLDILTGGASDQETMQISVNQNSWIVHIFIAENTHATSVPIQFCPTSNGAAESYDGLGQLLSYKISNDNAPTYTAKALYAHGYVC